MEILSTGIDGLVQIIPKIHKDDRGWFQEIYKASLINSLNDNLGFQQDNISYSKKNVLRGLHVQIGASSQAKLVTVLDGKVLDVVVDLRPKSSTFGKSFQVELNSEIRNLLFVPEGFAHGFSALENSVFLYKCSKEYDPKNETGIIWNDPELNINWMVKDPIISAKDQLLPSFKDLLRKSVISH